MFYKPRIVEAMQFTGENYRQIEDWSEREVFSSPVLEPTEYNPTGVYLQFLNRYIGCAIVGDWIIKSASGGFFKLTNYQFKEMFPCEKGIESLRLLQKKTTDDLINKQEEGVDI